LIILQVLKQKIGIEKDLISYSHVNMAEIAQQDIKLLIGLTLLKDNSDLQILTHQ
jgi:hypothetical protein